MQLTILYEVTSYHTDWDPTLKIDEGSQDLHRVIRDSGTMKLKPIKVPAVQIKRLSCCETALSTQSI